MRIAAIAVAAVFACATQAAHADTFQTFEVAISFEHGIGFGGLITLDTTTDVFTSLAGVPGGLPTGNGFFMLGGQGVSGGNYFVDGFGSGPYLLQIVLPVSALAGYTGGAVCTESLGPGCFSSSTLDFRATGGSLTPLASTAVTPEPSSIALLGTGMLGLAGLLRKRVF